MVQGPDAFSVLAPKGRWSSWPTVDMFSKPALEKAGFSELQHFDWHLLNLRMIHIPTSAVWLCGFAFPAAGSS